MIVQEGPRGNAGYADARLIPLRDLEAIKHIIDRATGISAPAPDEPGTIDEPAEPDDA